MTSEFWTADTEKAVRQLLAKDQELRWKYSDVEGWAERQASYSNLIADVRAVLTALATLGVLTPRDDNPKMKWVKPFRIAFSNDSSSLDGAQFPSGRVVVDDQTAGLVAATVSLEELLKMASMSGGKLEFETDLHPEDNSQMPHEPGPLCENKCEMRCADE